MRDIGCYSKAPRSAPGFASKMIYIVHKSSYLISISLNGLHGKLIDQKESVQNSVLHKTRITSITSIRLFSAGSIAMRKKIVLFICRKHSHNLDI